MKRLLIIGSNGYVGRNLATLLLRRGCNLTTINRRADRPQERGFTGDVTRRFFGWGRPEVIGRLSGIEAAVNCAGLTRFGEKDRNTLFDVNALGARHVYEACCEAGIPVLHHVSTAFVAGSNREFLDSNDLDAGQSFRNPYEESKFEAEKFLRNQKTAIRVRIYRPSIIVGGRVTGSSGSANTIYAFIKAGLALKDFMKKERSVRIEADSATGLNIVSMRRVTETIMHHIENPGSKPCAIHTLIHHRNLSVQSVKDEICHYFGIQGVSFVPAFGSGINKLTVGEKFLRRITRNFGSYLYSSPEVPVRFRIMPKSSSPETPPLPDIIHSFVKEIS